MVRAIIITNDSQKKRLLTVLEKRKKVLLKVTGSLALLKDELESIKREYYFRVGSLLRRDNDLDLEIIKYKNLLVCLKRGMSYTAAIESIKNSFYSETEYVQDFSYANQSELPIKEDGGQDTESLRLLWKKIVTKFHPDLTVDFDEKKRREEIMKQVNNAYANGDREALEEIYKSNHTVPLSEVDVQDLKQMLTQVENSIIKIQKEMVALKKTEWFGWKTKIKKAKKSGKDIFRELEYALLDDIVKKSNLLSELKKRVDTLTGI